MGLSEILYTKLFVLLVVYSKPSKKKMLAKISSNNSKMTDSYFWVLTMCKPLGHRQINIGHSSWPWEAYTHFKRISCIMCPSRSNNLLQYIPGEADDKSWRISEPPGCSTGTTGHLSWDLKLSSWSKGIGPFYLHFSLWMWVIWEGVWPWTRAALFNQGSERVLATDDYLKAALSAAIGKCFIHVSGSERVHTASTHEPHERFGITVTDSGVLLSGIQLAPKILPGWAAPNWRSSERPFRTIQNTHDTLKSAVSRKVPDSSRSETIKNDSEGWYVPRQASVDQLSELKKNHKSSAPIPVAVEKKPKTEGQFTTSKFPDYQVTKWAIL